MGSRRILVVLAALALSVGTARAQGRPLWQESDGSPIWRCPIISLPNGALSVGGDGVCSIDVSQGIASGVVLDLADDGANESVSVAELAFVGFCSEPSADKVLCDFTNNAVPLATALAANGANCSAGQYPLGVSAAGAAESCTADDDTPDTDAEVPNAITVGTLGTNAEVVGPAAAADKLACFSGDSSLTYCDYPDVVNIEVDNAVVTSGASSIDFGLGFDVTDSPAGEANVVLDLTEITVAANTAAALAANGGNCSAGSAPIGVDAAGAAESCTAYQAADADLTDLADGSLTGTKVAFADTDANFTAADVQAAIEELDNVNGSGVNAADGKVEWSQLVGVPAGFADGADASSGGGGGDMRSCKTLMTIGAGDDGLVLDSFNEARNLVLGWCSCVGTCTTAATIQFRRNDGTSAVIDGAAGSDGTMTCTSRASGDPTAVTFTGGTGAEEVFTTFDVLEMDVTNTPSGDAGTMVVCWTWTTP